jgi:hypothetical protein
MWTKAEILALKTSNQVDTAIAATAANSPYASSNVDVAAQLNLGQGASFNLWLTKALRQFYKKTREGLSNHQ